MCFLLRRGREEKKGKKKKKPLSERGSMWRKRLIAPHSRAWPSQVVDRQGGDRNGTGLNSVLLLEINIRQNSLLKSYHTCCKHSKVIKPKRQRFTTAPDMCRQFRRDRTASLACTADPFIKRRGQCVTFLLNNGAKCHSTEVQMYFWNNNKYTYTKNRSHRQVQNGVNGSGKQNTRRGSDELAR